MQDFEVFWKSHGDPLDLGAITVVNKVDKEWLLLDPFLADLDLILGVISAEKYFLLLLFCFEKFLHKAQINYFFLFFFFKYLIFLFFLNIVTT